jgi:hypothetical protein
LLCPAGSISSETIPSTIGEAAANSDFVCTGELETPVGPVAYTSLMSAAQDQARAQNIQQDESPFRKFIAIAQARI